MRKLETSELVKIFKEAGFYYRVCHEDGKILVGPNKWGNVPDMEFTTQEEAQFYLLGWNAAIQQGATK